MPKKMQMCENEACEKHLVPTSIMGGCDCGSPLVPYKSEPSQEQIENVALAMLGEPGYWMVHLNPQAGRDFHEIVQKVVAGDEEAMLKLAFMKEAASVLKANTEGV